MAYVRIRVYDTLNSEFTFDKEANVSTYGDIKKLINPKSGTRYIDRATKEDAFLNEGKLVTGDVIIFSTPGKSKAG